MRLPIVSTRISQRNPNRLIRLETLYFICQVFRSLKSLSLGFSRLSDKMDFYGFCGFLWIHNYVVVCMVCSGPRGSIRFFTKRQNFSLVQTESVCRRQNEISCIKDVFAF